MDNQQDSPRDELREVGRSVLGHLKKHQPKLYKYLTSTGEVMEYVLQAQEMAEDYRRKAEAAGRPFDETEEIIRETWISLPDVDERRDD